MYKHTENNLTMCIFAAHYLVCCHENIQAQDNVDPCCRIHAAVVGMSENKTIKIA